MEQTFLLIVCYKIAFFSPRPVFLSRLWRDKNCFDSKRMLNKTHKDLENIRLYGLSEMYGNHLTWNDWFLNETAREWELTCCFHYSVSQLLTFSFIRHHIERERNREFHFHLCTERKSFSFDEIQLHIHRAHKHRSEWDATVCQRIECVICHINGQMSSTRKFNENRISKINMSYVCASQHYKPSYINFNTMTHLLHCVSVALYRRPFSELQV